MKKTLQFISVTLWLWLCFSFPSFTRNSKEMKESFSFVVHFITKFVHNENIALTILLFFIPLFSLISCVHLAYHEKKNKYKLALYILMSIFSLLSIPIFWMILLIGLGN